MANMRAILLDPNNRHPLIESDLGPRVQHFIAQNTCVTYIQNEMAGYRRIDLFLPSADSGIIGTNLPLFNNIYFHLYCPTTDDIPHYEAVFPQRAYVQIFEEAYLWTEIGYVLLGYDTKHLQKSNYSDEARTIYDTTHRIILAEVEAARLGVQPA